MCVYVYIVDSDQLVLHISMYIWMISETTREKRIEVILRLLFFCWTFRTFVLIELEKQTNGHIPGFFSFMHSFLLLLAISTSFDCLCLLIHCYRLSICAEQCLLVFIFFILLSISLRYLWFGLFSSLSFRPMRSARNIFNLKKNTLHNFDQIEKQNLDSFLCEISYGLDFTRRAICRKTMRDFLRYNRSLSPSSWYFYDSVW